MGTEMSLAEREFFCVVNHATFRQLRKPVFIKFGHKTYFGVLSRNPERQFQKFSLYGSFSPNDGPNRKA